MGRRQKQLYLVYSRGEFVRLNSRRSSANQYSQQINLIQDYYINLKPEFKQTLPIPMDVQLIDCVSCPLGVLTGSNL